MNEFKYGSLRAKYARLGHKLNKAPIFCFALAWYFCTNRFCSYVLNPKESARMAIVRSDRDLCNCARSN